MSPTIHHNFKEGNSQMTVTKKKPNFKENVFFTFFATVSSKTIKPTLHEHTFLEQYYNKTILVPSTCQKRITIQLGSNDNGYNEIKAIRSQFEPAIIRCL